MNEFYEFDERSHQRRGGFWKYIAIALVFLFVGALGMHYIGPILEGAPQNLVERQNSKEDQETIVQQETEQPKPESLPALGAKGDLFIKSDNPVIEIAEKVGPAVVGITKKMLVKQQNPFLGESEESKEGGSGSGIIISEDGYIVTNNHVVEDADELVVILKGGKEISATLVGRDSFTDVAVLKVDEPDLTVAKIGDSDQVRQGELAIAIGNPLGHALAGTLTVGVVSAVDRDIRFGQHDFKMIQTDAAINHGNSGGALINAQGEIIGMNTLKSYAEGLGFAIPTNVFVPIVEQLIKEGGIERPGIGVQIVEVTEELIKEYNFPKGIGVVALEQGGSADKAGILPNDIIIAVGDKTVQTIDELKDEITKGKVGDILKFTVWRNEKEFVIPIKLQQLDG
ncbi:MAG TPA: trypsin-like peptidase domain-containing protein [Clostridia bacterium]|nr:trypsin-like peptidase domain-containing protein [Clostridia bacterium]